MIMMSLKQKSLAVFVQQGFTFCGENRIRTCETLLTPTRFPDVPLQPLEHLSFNSGCKDMKKITDAKTKHL